MFNSKKPQTNLRSQEKAYFTIDETASYLSLSRRSVERLTASGELPYAKFGRVVRIPILAIRAYERASLETPHMSSSARERILDAICGSVVA